GPNETADAVRAVSLVDMMDRGRVYWTLRSLMLSRREEIGIFDELFERFWSFEPQPTRPPMTQGMGPAGGMRDLKPRPRSIVLPENDSRSDDTFLQIVRTGASAAEVAAEKDLTVLQSNELSELSRIAARMVRALASRPGRRRKRHKRKGIPDLRGALRLNLATGGEPIRLPRMRRVPRVPRLMVLLDVSGSMDRHASLLLQLVYAVTQHTKRVETFVFSTSVTRVTRQMKAPSFGEALRRVGAAVDHWSGGTRIGESIARINADYEGLQDRYTTVFLLSDGWETGEPQQLAREMRRMQRRVRSVVWLNPLLGTQDYEPLARGLQAVMPYVDHFVSAKDISHLKRLPQLLRA
ncbi:MAG: VWA domain-containing protein, partial [Chloroflexi bacterium]|nr:VWA domain-containing protein [Chloroflexota bacterium]